MCCRVAQGSAKDKVKKKVKAKGQAPDVAPRLNLAPTQDALVAVHESGDTQLEAMRWGLIPPCQGQVDRGQTGQRAGRDNRRKAQLSGAVPAAALPVAGGRLF